MNKISKKIKRESLDLLMVRPTEELFYLLGGDWQLQHDPDKVLGHTKIGLINLYKTSSYQKTVNIGKKIYRDLKVKIYDEICIKWKLCKRIKNYDDKTTFLLALAGILTNLTGKTVNSLTLAALLFKKGIKKFCKCSKSA